MLDSMIILPLLVVAGCVNGAIRLIGGTSASEGRLEVCADQQWATVCGDLWGEPDARVVCRQLGYSIIGMCSL
jgi:deleted-in-malignant-brain-tumors protein 1